MLTISDNRPIGLCNRTSRREFLRVGSLGLGAFSLSQMLAARADAAASSFIRDKSVVLLFLQGGPPQIEMFDPKMEAPSNVRSCTGEVSSKLPGVTLGGTFPKLAAMADRLAVVRSFASGDGGHNQMPVLTGKSESEATMGSQYARLAGTNHPVTSVPTHSVLLPEQVDSTIKLGEPTGPFSYGYIRKNYPNAGQLGAAYSGLLLDGGDGLMENLTRSMPRDRFGDRRNLLSQLDGFRRRFDGTGELDSATASEQQAVDVLLRGISDAFDLTKEDPRTIAKYDTSHLFRMEDWHKGGRHYNGLRNQSRITNLLGKQMLLARRLCENGCGFVTVVDGCWDFHGDGNNPPTPVGMPLLGPQVDHAVAAFLEDLEERGLSDKILLVITGEMGRSPKKGGRNGGTGHWGRLTPLLVAGGGLRMGQVVGTTDRQGGEATSQQYLPQHLRATIMQTLFDAGEARLIPGLPTEIARSITTDEPIHELIG